MNTHATSARNAFTPSRAGESSYYSRDKCSRPWERAGVRAVLPNAHLAFSPHPNPLPDAAMLIAQSKPTRASGRGSQRRRPS